MSSLTLWQYIGRSMVIGGIFGVAASYQPRKPMWNTLAGGLLGLVTSACGLYILKNATPE